MTHSAPDTYLSLALRMNQFPTGIPQTEEMRAVLRELFTVDEAALAVLIPARGAPADVLADSAGRPVEAVRALLEVMADKGLVYPYDRRGIRQYTLMGLAPGIIDLHLITGARTPDQTRLARLFEEYYRTGGLAELHKGPPWTRVLTVERDLPADIELFSYERVSNVIHSVSSYALAHCYCREETALAGHGCGAPTDVCMQFGPFADYLVERGFARRANQDDMLHALDRAEKAALVHLTNNSQSGFSFICNCCGCCCGMLRGINQLNRLDTIAKSRLEARVRAEDCMGCAACIDRCQVNALTVPDEMVLVDTERCIGCGLCVQSCPTTAIELRVRSVSMAPYVSRADLEVARLHHRGLG